MIEIGLGLLALSAALIALGMLAFVSKGANAHNEKKAQEQAQLDRKHGKPARADLAPLPGKASLGVAGIIAVLLICGAVWWSLPWRSPSVSTVTNWVGSYWFFILIVGGLALLVIPSFGGTYTARLQTTVWGVVLMLFILIPFIHFIAWIATPSPAPVTQVVPLASSLVPLASSPRSSWSKVIIPAGGESERIPLPASMHRIRVDGGKYQLYTVYADGKKCAAYGTPTCPDGAVIEYYVVNEEAASQTVLYAFVSN